MSIRINITTQPSSKSAFTLIELLVVIVIIGILATLITVTLTSVRGNARDARRISDLKQISSALELYLADHSSYPDIITPGNALTSPDGGKTYMAKIPTNPTPRAEGPCANANYFYAGYTSNYALIGCLAKNSGEALAGARKLGRDGSISSLGTTNGLVGWWLFDESDGTTIYDSSASKMHASLLGAIPPQRTNRNGAGALSFNGANHVKPNVFVSSLWTTWSTLSVWIQLSTTTQDTAIAGHLRNSHWTTYGKGIKYYTGYIRAMGENADNKNHYDAPLSDINNWHHVAVTFVADGKIYIDGVEYPAGDLSSGYNYRFAIGAAAGDSDLETPSRFFKGNLDDVRIYTRALSHDEIKEIYNATK